VKRVALIGLDGATFRVLDVVLAAGAMPALARLRERGVEATLRSTVPTYTPPAWVSMATGVNPGRHGVFGFLATTAQEPPQIAHSGLIDAPPVWEYLGEQDIPCGMFNIPMSYPPASVNGFMVAGGLASGWTDSEMPNFASDVEIGRLVLELAGGQYPLDTVVSYENDWRSRKVSSRLREIQRVRNTVLKALIEAREPEFVFAVFEGPDRLQHLHYQYIVEESDWYRRSEASEVRERTLSYFAELDNAIDDLADWAGSDGVVVIVSDHGFGPWEKTININLLLDKWGYLVPPSVSRLTRLPVIAGRGQRMARRILPRRILHTAKAKVERGIKWNETVAFASHVAEQGIHINEQGRLPHGVVEPHAVERLTTDIIQRLREFVDPDDGAPVVDRLILRTEIIHGRHASRAPDLFPFCRDQRYELSDTLAASSVLSDHRDRPWGYHHVDGVFIGAGTAFGDGTYGEGLDIVDVLPTTLHAAGLSVPAGLDGRVVAGVLSETAASTPIVHMHMEGDYQRSREYPFSPDEERVIEESLRGLGYLE
jgi:predicted AlkP superfamily phosphohydrolase/phosphomutase